MEKKRKSIRVGTVILLLVLLLIAALLAVLPRLARSAASEDGRVIVQSIVEQNALVHTITGGGMLEADESAMVKVHPGVRVTALNVAPGDTVHVGDAIAEVDKVSVMSAIAELQRTMDSLALQIRFLNIKTNDVRVDSDGVMYADGHEVKNENIVKYAQYITLSDEHRYCDARLQELFVLYQSGVITARSAGLIDALDKAVVEPLAFFAPITREASNHTILTEESADPVGDALSSEAKTSVSWGGARIDDSIEPELFGAASRTICEIVPMETARFKVSIPEQEVTGIVPDMTVEVLLDALSGQTFEGRVTEVGKFGSGGNGSSKFTVTIELPFSEGMLPGMSATAIFTLNTRKASLTVPVAALAELDGKNVIYTGRSAESGELQDPVEVALGFSDGKYVEIASDSLRRGQVIYYESFE